MEQLENNAYFWQKMDTLLLSSTCKIAHEKGSAHPKYPNLIYPVDYGYLQDTVGTDSQPIHVYKGSLKAQNVDAIVVSADILKKDCEVKLLIGCNEDEKLKILEFLNQTQFQKAILIQRGNQIPSWANND
ncbi:Inorganic pyrophosphatase [Faecalicoccus acidiformans]|uniref:Inorganic pyrophosphatase n=1 Tax=Faecalicoccus acidiformans TaxID=915173 RepID=UPI003209A2ED